MLAELRMSLTLKLWITPEDVAQDVILSALVAKASFDPSRAAKLRPWLAAITERTIKTAHRKMVKESPVVRLGNADSATAGAVAADELAGSFTTPSLAAIRNESYGRLLRALQSLREDYRQVIVLRQLHGHKLGDVAKRMHRKPSAAAMLLARALVQLRRLLAKQGDEVSARRGRPGSTSYTGRAAARRKIPQQSDTHRKRRRPEVPSREKVD